MREILSTSGLFSDQEFEANADSFEGYGMVQ
jgi:hypothetical protein